MKISSLRYYLCLATIGFGATQASAQVLFSDNFNVNSSAAWKINAAPTANAAQQSATFAFDYSALGIPAAPGGDGTTIGVRLRANVPGPVDAPVTTRPTGTVSGLTISPLDKNFGTNYQMEFYAWSNHFGYNGNLADNNGSQGGTNNVLFSVGTSGTVPIVLGNPGAITGAAPDGVAFATTGDGGIGDDYRAFAKSATHIPAATAGVYEALATATPGTTPPVTATQNVNTFYTGLFPAVAAPLEQVGIAASEYAEPSPILNPMLGTSQAGSFGFAWQKVKIAKSGSTVTWTINDALIATVSTTGLTMGGSNIALGVSDVNTSTARYPSLVFTVFDNLVVTALPSTGPEGDFTGDGIVDGADFLKWQRGESPNPSSTADLNLWKANFGVTAAVGAVSAVPEPSAIGLGLLGTAIVGFAARRQS